MVQTLTRERVEVERISLEQLGEMVGIPIVVRPWWGSAREGSTSGAGGVSRWVCPGGHTGNQKRRPEVQNLAHVSLPPDLRIVLWEGACRLKTPYRTRYGYGHTHGQSIEVKSIGDRAMLVVIRLSSIPSLFLLGMDGEAPYAVQVPCRLNTTNEALDWLMPNIVRQAIEQGLEVKRQGDWYFIPRDRPPASYGYYSRVYGSRPELKTNTLYRGAALVFNCTQTRHTGGMVVYQTLQGVNGPAPLVKGNVRAPDHPTLKLEDWHTGVRNRSHPWRNASEGRARFDD
ncbi:hypothetical protein ES703_30483 [subsurface metagenome]